MTKVEVPTITEEYYQWLCDKVACDLGGKKYYILLRALSYKEFYWTIPNDDNRAVDGVQLREKFFDETMHEDSEYDKLEGPCSMLEMMIALAMRCENTMTDEDHTDRTPQWFWQMIVNSGLVAYDDGSLTQTSMFEIDQILNHILERSYRRDGVGGLFPLKDAKKDQRRVEIWYQMYAFLLENYGANGEIA